MYTLPITLINSFELTKSKSTKSLISIENYIKIDLSEVKKDMVLQAEFEEIKNKVNRIGEIITPESTATLNLTDTFTGTGAVVEIKIPKGMWIVESRFKITNGPTPQYAHCTISSATEFNLYMLKDIKLNANEIAVDNFPTRVLSFECETTLYMQAMCQGHAAVISDGWIVGIRLK